MYQWNSGFLLSKTSQEQKCVSMQILAVTDIGSNMIRNVRESLTPICSQLPICTSSCPRVLGSAESYTSTDNTEKVGRTLQSLQKTFGNVQ